MVDRQRVCEVYGDGDTAGTGYLVADGLVLTAAHVVEDGAARLRFPAWDPTGLHPARPVWTSTGLDAALLRLDATGWRPPAGLSPVQWGRLVTGRTRIRAEALGFPDAHADGPAGLREWSHVSGTVNA